MSGLALWPAVAVAGALGSMARVTLAAWVGGARGIALINLSGGLALGVMAGAGVDGDWMVVLGAGLLGAFTTFSTWMVDTVALHDAGRSRAAVANVLGQALLGLALAGLGLATGAAIAG